MEPERMEARVGGRADARRYLDAEHVRGEHLVHGQTPRRGEAECERERAGADVGHRGDVRVVEVESVHVDPVHQHGVAQGEPLRVRDDWMGA